MQFACITGYEGRIETDPSKPDGTQRKLMDASRLRDMGWQASIGLEDGIRETYRWFVENKAAIRA